MISRLEFVIATLFSISALSQEHQSVSSIDSNQLSFTKSSQVFEPAFTRHILLRDFDGDGDLDAVFANCKLNNSRILLNNGHGEFVATEQLLSPQAHGIDVGDLDGDGDLDIFITCHYYFEDNLPYNSPSKVYLNNGRAVFSEHKQEFGDSLLSGNVVHLHDIDSDGDLDAMINYAEEPSKIYFNDGKANFSASNLTHPTAHAFGDLNNDGNIDIWVSIFGTGHEIWFGNENGALSRSLQFEDSTVAYTPISLADLDGDGDLDAVVSNFDRNGSHPTKIWYNDGAGRFTNSNAALPGVFRGRVTLGDLNNDGFADAVAANHDNQVHIWINDGAGLLVDTGLRLGSKSDKNEGAALGDIDNDGDLDIFIAEGRGGKNSIWINELINK